MKPSSKIKFRPLPHTMLPASRGTTEVKVEIQEGEVARFLMLPDYLSGYLNVHLDEEDPHGLPGNFFIVKTIGRSEASCGGYIGEHRGPTTLKLWFSNESASPAFLRGAIGIEPIDAVNAEGEQEELAAVWEKRKEMAFEKAMSLLPVVFNTILARSKVSPEAIVERLRSLVRTLDAPQLASIMDALDPLQKQILIEIVERLIATGEPEPAPREDTRP